MISGKPDAQIRSYLTPTEVASMLMVSSHTVRKWVKKGWLSAEHTPGGHRRFLREEIEQFARDRGLTLNCRQGDGLRVLFVTINRHQANEVEQVFQEVGDAIIAIASSVFDAGRRIVLFTPDVVLLGASVPFEDQTEICRLLRAEPQTRAIQIITFGASSDSEHGRTILAAGAEHCIETPVNWDYVCQLMGVAPAM